MIELKNVSKTYENGTKALKDVTLSIKQGEFVFVVGASGAGKSTFLKLILREEVPSSGGIVVNGYDLMTIPKKEIPYFRRTMGVVFQDFRLIQTMTVFDNVAFAMRVIGANEREIRKRVPYVLSLVGLASKARNLPAELSGGEQQRVALARALVNNADMIIADEPTGNVDPEMSYEIVELLNHINASGTTVVMVTHEHDLVRQFNHRTVVIENGSVTYDGMGGDSFSFSSESAQRLREMNMKADETLKHDGMTGYYDISGADETSRFINSYLSEKGHEKPEDEAEKTLEPESETKPETTESSAKRKKSSWNKLAVKKGKKEKSDSDKRKKEKAEKEETKAEVSSEVKDVSESVNKETKGGEGDISVKDTETKAENPAEEQISSVKEEQNSDKSEKNSAEEQPEKADDTADEENEKTLEAEDENGSEESRKRAEAVRDALGKSIKESLLEGYSIYLNGSGEKKDNGGDSDEK